MIQEPNIQPVMSPAVICGNLHGQLHDLLELFSQGGDIADRNYVFMGDYVDRGYYSVEVFQLLLCYKIKYKSKVTLLRGNHESRQLTKAYGFYDETIRKYGNPNVWRYCAEVFETLGVAAVSWSEGRWWMEMCFACMQDCPPAWTCWTKLILLTECATSPCADPSAT